MKNTNRYEVYKIQNKVNKKYYIGITTQGWEQRCLKHKSDARLGCDFKLHRAIRKYGVDNFEFTLLETCKDLEELKERESFWIEALNLTSDEFGYNMTLGGDGTFGRKHSNETKELISKISKGSSKLRIPIEVKIEGGSKLFKNGTEAARYANVSHGSVTHHIRNGKKEFNVKGVEFFIREDLILKMSKPKKTKRNPEQIASHMKMMQDKSRESRKNNKEHIAKGKETRLKRGQTKVIQQFKDNELIAEYNGSREVVEKNPGFNRSGLQHNLKERTKSYKGFVFKFK